MSDPRFQSVHLDGLPRRELFRAARARLEADCGAQTLAGDLALLDEGDPGDGPTITAGFPSDASFWVQDGEQLYQLSIGVNTIGRLPDNTLVIRDECVSRRHCAIVVHHDGSCDVHDVASKNGTILNGKKISGPMRLRSGDHIGLCSRKLVFLARRSHQYAPSSREDARS
jgi:pSer/pThr/pTyr-binding forkhead associated (FHA) protein